MGGTVLFLTVCSCLVSFLTTDLIGHAVFTFWLLLILCYFGLYKQGIGCYTVYLVTVVGYIWRQNTAYHFHLRFC